MLNYKMYINGSQVDAESGKTYTAVNPATGEEIAKIPLGDKADVAKAVEAAKKAFPIWSAKSQNERSEILNKLADILSGYSEELGKLECMDHGFPIRTAMGMSRRAVTIIRKTTETANSLYGETATRRAEAFIYMQREPIGVCALITPWNVPLIMAMTKLSMCLAAGNTCILKPPSIDSITTLKLAEAIEKSELPEGVINIISGPGGIVGEALASHPDVRMISFTGSSEVGKRIMELGSRNVKRLSLELGGKNPFIVMEDADIDAAVHCAIHSSYFNCGQICASPGRYYLHKNVYDEFMQKFTEAAGKLVVGNPTNEKTQMGPVVSKEQRESVENYIKSGIEEGAKLVLGGKRPADPALNKGYFITPTIFTGVKLYMKIAREEIFGPVACIMEPFSDYEAMIESANDNVFGLGGSVWSTNTTKAMKIASAIQTGAMWINEHMTLVEGMPWGGVKESGIGRENYHGEIEEYTSLKTVYVDLTEMKRRPWNEM